MSDEIIGGPCKTCGQQGFFNCCDDEDRKALELFPDITKAVATDIREQRPKIQELIDIIEVHREQIRGQWPEAKDPEKFKMELVAYHLSQSLLRLRELLKAIDE